MKQFIDKKIFNMGKLKEKLLNNLTPEEMDERFGLSAFEYVEYMENYKHLFDDSGNPISEDVLEQLKKEREQLENDFLESLNDLDRPNIPAQFDGYRINESIQTRYCLADIESALDSANVDSELKQKVLNKLNELWADRVSADG